MFIAPSPPNPSGALRRSGTQVYGYRPGSFRSSEGRMVLVVLGSINISLLRSEDLRLERTQNHIYNSLTTRNLIRGALRVEALDQFTITLGDHVSFDLSCRSYFILLNLKVAFENDKPFN